MENSKPIGFECRRMSHIIGRGISAQMAREGFDEVAITHGWILGYLVDHREEVIYQRDLEERFGLARSTVANMVKLMEQDGYIVRETDKGDARYKRVLITEEGVQVHSRAVRLIDGFNEKLEQGLSEEEKEEFFRVIDKISENLQKINENGGTTE